MKKRRWLVIGRLKYFHQISFKWTKNQLNTARRVLYSSSLNSLISFWTLAQLSVKWNRLYHDVGLYERRRNESSLQLIAALRTFKVKCEWANGWRFVFDYETFYLLVIFNSSFSIFWWQIFFCKRANVPSTIFTILTLAADKLRRAEVWSCQIVFRLLCVVAKFIPRPYALVAHSVFERWFRHWSLINALISAYDSGR